MQAVKEQSQGFRSSKDEDKRAILPFHRQSRPALHNSISSSKEDFLDDTEHHTAYSAHDVDITRPMMIGINSHFLKQCFCSDVILKFLVCVCYGILPSFFKNHTKKRRCSFITIFLTLLQWITLMSYTYFINTYWNDKKYGPIMPREAKFIKMGLVASCAFNLTLGAWFLYSKSTYFTKRREDGIALVPQVKFSLPGTGDQSKDVPLTPKDWFLTNVFLLFGFIFSSVVIFVDFQYNIFLDCSHMHDFVTKLSQLRKLHYHISVSMEFFGFYATVCTICIYHALTRDLIRHIDATEEYILTTAKDRDDFQAAIDTLQKYDETLMQTIKWWFAVHTLFFTLLIVAIIVEWLKAFEVDILKKENLYHFIFAQISGSFFIAFKFAFPFLSASCVTSRYTKFYCRIARRCMIQNLPRLSILHDNSGVKLIGVRITTKLAVLAFMCSFLGALKFITGWKDF